MTNQFSVKSQTLQPHLYQSAFTIVELLVVIVVIGILATITVASYTGLTQKATLASISSDLDNASKLLKMDQVINSAYPASLAAANSGKGIPASYSTIYADYQVDNSTNPPGFCLYATGPNNTSYRITDDSKPSPGNCSRTSCLAILNANESIGNGIYWIKPAGTAFRAYCDMTTNGGGWTRILYLVDNGVKTYNLLDKGIQFSKFRAVKATDRSIYQQATFSTTQTATTGLDATAIEANTHIMLIGPGGYGVWTGVSIICNWGSVVMFGSGWDTISCGTESALRVGRDIGGTASLTERFDVELFVQ